VPGPQESERQVPPLVRQAREPSGPWSWSARPDRGAGRADGPGDPDVRHPRAGPGARPHLGEGLLRQGAAGPVQEALRAEPPEPARSVEFLPQVRAAGDARLQAGPVSAHAPAPRDAVAVPAYRPGSGPVPREPAVPDEAARRALCRREGWVARRVALGHGVGEEPRAPLPERSDGGLAVHRARRVPPALLRAAGADRVPRRRLGRLHPGPPACVPGPGGHRGAILRPAGPAVSGGRRAGVPPLRPVLPGPRREASRIPAGMPTRSPAAASGEGRCSQETDWKAS
jgi:hypothetical protein